MTRKEKIEDERIRQQRLQDVEDYNKFGRTRTTRGIAKLDAGETLRTGKNVFKKGDIIENKGGRIGVGNFDSLRKQKGGKSEAAGELGDTTYGDSTYKPTKGSRDNMSKKDIRRENKILAKEGRKNRRAEKMAKDKGMSNQQAKDFQQNRRDRFRQMGTNFVKGLTGNAMDTAVDDRLMRRDGSGTLQNMKTEDGKTVDATAPYKGSASKGFTDRGQSRNEADDYVRSLNPKKDDDLPSKMITIPAYKAPEPEDVIREDTEDKTEKVLNPPKENNKMSNKNFPQNFVTKDTIAFGSQGAKGNFYDSNQTITGFPDTAKATNFNIDLSKVDRSGIQDTINDFRRKKAESLINPKTPASKFNSLDILYDPTKQ